MVLSKNQVIPHSNKKLPFNLSISQFPRKPVKLFPKIKTLNANI